MGFNSGFKGLTWAGTTLLFTEAGKPKRKEDFKRHRQHTSRDLLSSAILRSVDW